LRVRREEAEILLILVETTISTHNEILLWSTGRSMRNPGGNSEEVII